MPSSASPKLYGASIERRVLVDALGDKVMFGSATTALLSVDPGAEAGSTAGTASIGLTKVVNAADGMEINFTSVTGSHFIADETAAVASATSLTMAENEAVNAFAGTGVAYFSFHGNEYFIATANFETAVSSHDAIVELVGVTDIHHASSSPSWPIVCTSRCAHGSNRWREALTPRAVLDKLAAVQMLDVNFPTTDGRTLVMRRYTELGPEQKLLVKQLKLDLPPQPPPRITAPATTVPVPPHPL